MNMKRKVGVIGAGSFGTAVSNILAENNEVLLYVRKPERVNIINIERKHKNQEIHPNITAIESLEELCKECKLIFPIVPSGHFQEMLRDLSQCVTPEHILIHGTKGFHVTEDISNENLNRNSILTMSELILQETDVVRVGCLAGPNLATEIGEHQIAATVIGSEFDEVINAGMEALQCNRFKVFGSNEMVGIELAGILKNYIAIAAGMASGLGYGDNAKALLITRGLAEMIFIAKALGQHPQAFLGVAGIGDLIATCNSKLSRNFRVGYFLTQGKSLEDTVAEIGEVAEGVKTLQVVKGLKHYGFKAPIAETLYNIVFNDLSPEEGVHYLMNLNVTADVAFI